MHIINLHVTISQNQGTGKKRAHDKARKRPMIKTAELGAPIIYLITSLPDMKDLPFHCWLSTPTWGSQNMACYFMCSFHCICCLPNLLFSFLSICPLLFTCCLEHATPGFQIDLILHWLSAQLLPIRGCLSFSPSLKQQLHLHSSSYHSFLFSSWYFSISEFLVHLLVYCLCSP